VQRDVGGFLRGKDVVSGKEIVLGDTLEIGGKTSFIIVMDK